MKSQTIFRSAALLCAALAMGASATPASARCSDDGRQLIENLDGSWRGSGTVQPIGGAKERISCRVNYNAAGARIKQKISCAGTDYKFDADANVACNGNTISGTWTERVANNTGRVSGSIRNQLLRIDVQSPNFDGRFAVRVANRRRHSLTITQFDPGRGRHVPVAEISLRR